MRLLEASVAVSHLSDEAANSLLLLLRLFFAHALHHNIQSNLLAQLYLKQEQ